MRVISGKYRGKKLFSPETESIRPTADKVKQAIFTKLQFDIPNSEVLDLFCGSGAMGIEAISRGAKNVVMADIDSNSISLTYKNLNAIKEQCMVINKDFRETLKTIKKQFDFIFVDPPYKSGYYKEVLSIIYDQNLLKPDGVVVCEHLRDNKIESSFYNCIDKKTYGTVSVSYLQIK